VFRCLLTMRCISETTVGRRLGKGLSLLPQGPTQCRTNFLCWESNCFTYSPPLIIKFRYAPTRFSCRVAGGNIRDLRGQSTGRVVRLSSGQLFRHGCGGPGGVLLLWGGAVGYCRNPTEGSPRCHLSSVGTHEALVGAPDRMGGRWVLSQSC